MRRLIASLDAEDRLVAAGVACLPIAGLIVHPALGIALLGLGLVGCGVALALRPKEEA
jgi:hypothetical protein